MNDKCFCPTTFPAEINFPLIFFSTFFQVLLLSIVKINYSTLDLFLHINLIFFSDAIDDLDKKIST